VRKGREGTRIKICGPFGIRSIQNSLTPIATSLSHINNTLFGVDEAAGLQVPAALQGCESIGRQR